MSAQVEQLRHAATLMRDRAEASLSRENHWFTAHELTAALSAHGKSSSGHEVDAEHIESWDPAMAKVVADLLDAGADEVDRRVARDGEQILERANPVFHAMTELARTYLHEEG